MKVGEVLAKFLSRINKNQIKKFASLRPHFPAVVVVLRCRPALPLGLRTKRWDWDCSMQSPQRTLPKSTGGRRINLRPPGRVAHINLQPTWRETLTQVSRVMPSSASASFFICFIGFADASTTRRRQAN